MAAEFIDHSESVSVKRCRDEDFGFVDEKRWRQDESGSFTTKYWRHDVFLSFRGEDTRRNFTSHLYHSLKEKGINVFIDDRLPRGEDISQQLIYTIRSSRIAVVVFSRNYADSRWCLQELCEIMDCRKTHRQMVLPVFYDVDPSDVRKQRGHFGEVFARHQNETNIDRWRSALAEAGSLSGWDLTNAANGPEAKIVRKISGTICNELNCTYLDVAKCPVGIDHPVMQVNNCLNSGSNDVRFIVIWGLGGIGKTTLAKAVYNQFFPSFEGKSFLPNIGETSMQPGGKIRLQEQILYDILNFQKIKLGSIDRGINVIKERLRSRRVLLVLDDINHRSQLEALAREHTWFGSGSRIIITTRDLESVKEIKPEYIYVFELEPLNSRDSEQLFRLHAFQQSEPGEEFKEMIESVVCHCKGLPLALEVLGSYLSDLSVEEWKSALDQLRRAPHIDIQKILEMSYHSLGSDHYQKLFLDIACFFVGCPKHRVVRILEACDMSVKIALRVLSKRCLIKITEWGLVEMHDMIRDMGREIVRKESPENPGKRSRLFSKSDILKTLQNHLGTKKVEGLVLSSSYTTEEVDATAFAKLKQLRLLQLDNQNVIGDYGLMPKEIRWLRWHGFPLNFFPDVLCLENTVIIDIQYSKLATWKTSKHFFGHLKELNLSHSHLLTKTPDFSRFPSLEQLIMEDCTELKEIHPSIGCLGRLVSMNLKGCRKLECIPDNICRVKSLRNMDISGCSKINRLPDDFGELESLVEFLADGAPIMYLPLSFVNLKNLKTMSLEGCKKPETSSISALISRWMLKRKAQREYDQLNIPFSGLRSLTNLHLGDCDLQNENSLESIGCLTSLQILDLRGSHFYCLPGSVSSLPNLLTITLRDCPKLESIPDMPPSVKFVNCSNCARLSKFSYSGHANPELRLALVGCRNLSSESRSSILEKWNGYTLFIAGDDIPEVFEYKSRGPCLSFLLPTCGECEEKKLLVSTVVCPPDKQLRGSFLPKLPPFCIIRSKTSGAITYTLWMPGVTQNKDHIFVLSIPLSEFTGEIQNRGTTKVVINVESCTGWIVKAVGVHLQREKCQSCRLINDDYVEASTSHESPPSTCEEFLPENESSAEYIIDQWKLRVSDLTLKFTWRETSR